MKKTILLSLICFTFIAAQNILSQQRYVDEVFTNVDVEYDKVYGSNISIFSTLLGLSPQMQDLTMDIYTPSNDTVTDRPVVIMIHTGSFMPRILNGQATGDKSDNVIVEQCMQFAKKGYVACAINHRLGWNPTSDNEDVRRRSLIQAAYRGVQDTRTAIRFLRKSVAEDNNPYGLSCQVAVGGIGTGGYISLATASLNNYDTELTLPKFLDTSQDVDGDGTLDAVPYIIPEFFGDINGTSTGVLEELDLNGDGTPEFTDVTLCVPNHVGYSSSVDMVFNIGGALPDSSWIEPGEAPVASMHCYLDEFGPYEIGDILVPVTNEFVIEGHGSLVVVRKSTEFGNNDAFEGLSMEINDSWYGNGNGANNSMLQIQAQNDFGMDLYIGSDGNPTNLSNDLETGEANPPLWVFPGHEVYPGLFTVVAPRGDQLDPSLCDDCGNSAPSCFGVSWDEQGSPWDWWNNDIDDPAGYPQLAWQNEGQPEQPDPFYLGCLATNDNPDMSEEKGLAFASMIQEFIAPRIYAALDLSSELNTCSINDLNFNKKLIKVVDVTGREVNNNTKSSVLIKLFDDGSVLKTYTTK